MQPIYPVYIPSKGRAARFLTARTFDKFNVHYRVVVEPSQVEAYAAWQDRLLVLPENGKGLVYARNWIKDHATAEGHARHWQFDDDIYGFCRIFKGNKVPMAANLALGIAEGFVDRYENVGLASFNSQFFIPCQYGVTQTPQTPPFYLNARCYTCFLVLNELPFRWRRRYNEDTDMTLQVLAGNWCTILFNAFSIKTPETMDMTGGQTDIYVADGRLRMARQLESMWPGTVEVIRRHGRPQHHIKHDWQRFDVPLKKKAGLAIDPAPNEFGMKIKALKEITNPLTAKLYKENK